MKSAVLLSLLLLSSQAQTATKMQTTNTGHLDFLAIGKPSMIHINGESPGPQGEVKIDNNEVIGHFVISLAKLNSGIEMRDEHMKDKYLEISKYPKAELNIRTTAPEKSGDISNQKFSGTLTLHGIEKPVSGIFNLQNEGAKKNVQADFKIMLDDFGISIPSYAGMTVANEVKIKITLQLESSRGQP